MRLYRSFRSAQGRKILLIEDSPGEAELFRRALVPAWKLLEAGSPQPALVVYRTAQEALDVVKAAAEVHERPDLVVLDLDLPGATGLTFLRNVRKDFRLTGLAVRPSVANPLIKLSGGCYKKSRCRLHGSGAGTRSLARSDRATIQA